MKKYHINPETGSVGECVAQKQCRYGENALHYSNPESARRAFELSMEGEQIGKLKKAAAIIERGDLVKNNPYLDLIVLTDNSEIIDKLSPEEEREFWTQDTAMRDWYLDARREGLNHRGAMRVSEEWDHRLMEEQDSGVDWATEKRKILNHYLNP